MLYITTASSPGSELWTWVNKCQNTVTLSMLLTLMERNVGLFIRVSDTDQYNSINKQHELHDRTLFVDLQLLALLMEPDLISFHSPRLIFRRG